ncbi:hypothetical protein, partial [Escherichia coli]|uniref:hypothetical protein n=1 Tax=Escherichia coli TaxID=562 RepID=UPI001C45257C
VLKKLIFVAHDNGNEAIALANIHDFFQALYDTGIHNLNFYLIGFGFILVKNEAGGYLYAENTVLHKKNPSSRALRD